MLGMALFAGWGTGGGTSRRHLLLELLSDQTRVLHTRRRLDRHVLRLRERRAHLRLSLELSRSVLLHLLNTGEAASGSVEGFLDRSVLLRHVHGSGQRSRLLAHRSLDLFKAHHLSARRSRRLELGLLVLLLLLGRLLGGQTPDAGVCLELGNVLGLGVVFIASTRGLGLLLMLVELLLLLLEALLRWRRLTSIVQSLFFFKGTGDLVGGAKEVKVLAYTATTTKGIVVEGIASLIELVGQGIVGVVKVEAGASSVTDWSNW
jgi:hypothetical protein